MQDRALILAGGWRYTSYPCALAVGHATKIAKVLKDVKENLDRSHK